MYVCLFVEMLLYDLCHNSSPLHLSKKNPKKVAKMILYTMLA